MVREFYQIWKVKWSCLCRCCWVYEFMRLLLFSEPSFKSEKGCWVKTRLKALADYAIWYTSYNVGNGEWMWKTKQEALELNHWHQSFVLFHRAQKQWKQCSIWLILHGSFLQRTKDTKLIKVFITNKVILWEQHCTTAKQIILYICTALWHREKVN